MNAKGWKWLSVLLNRYHANDPGALLRFLPEGEEELAKEHTVQSSEISPVSIQPHCFLDRMHYSWMLSIIKKAEKDTRKIYFSVILPAQRSKIAQYLKIESAAFKYPSLIADLIRHFLFQQICKRPLQAPVFLETNELSPLLQSPKEQLVSVITLLGIQDLAPEFTTSIDQKLKDKVFRLMSEQQRDYLLRVLSDKSKRGKVSKVPLLPTISEHPDAFQKIIHRHGLAFLGKALAGLPEDFLWYLTHILDAGRAKILQQHYSKDVSLAPEKLAELRQEIMDLANHVEQRALS